MSLRALAIARSIRALVQGRNLVATAISGFFVKIIDLFHSASISESLAKLFGKSLSDTSAVTDDQAIAVSKRFSETPETSDRLFVDASKFLEDDPTTVDSIVIEYSKPLSEALGANEFSRVSLAKVLSDSANVTDDLDGQTTTEDDQEISFFKVLKNHSIINESDIKSIAKVLSESPSMEDSGSLFAQNYTVDTTYFAEDYVGESRAFT